MRKSLAYSPLDQATVIWPCMAIQPETKVGAKYCLENLQYGWNWPETAISQLNSILNPTQSNGVMCSASMTINHLGGGRGAIHIRAAPRIADNMWMATVMPIMAPTPRQPNPSHLAVMAATQRIAEATVPQRKMAVSTLENHIL